MSANKIVEAAHLFAAVTPEELEDLLMNWMDKEQRLKVLSLLLATMEERDSLLRERNSQSQ